MTRVFIDTNVWFSGFYRPSNTSKVIEAHVTNQLQAYVTPQIFNELIRNIKKKYPRALTIIEMYFQLSPPIFLPTPKSIPPVIKTLVHPGDMPLITACHLANIPYFITGNTKHFQTLKIQQQLKIQILTPTQAVKHFKL